MTRPLTILTGASRGMGFAMAQQLLAGGHELLCISRKTNDALAAQAQAAGLPCEQWTQDLARGDAAAQPGESSFSKVTAAKSTLIPTPS